MNYYAFMFTLGRTQTVQYNYILQMINRGEVQDLIQADINLCLECKGGIFGSS